MKACEISFFVGGCFVQARYQRGTTKAGEKRRNRLVCDGKVFVFQFSKPFSLRVAGGNNRPDTGPLFPGRV